MNCFPSMTGGDVRDDILQMQINSELGHSLSINKIGTKTQINLLAKNGNILSTYEIPDANASNIKSMELVDQNIVLTFSDGSSVTCSLADIYSKIDTKQDIISDLDTIREGAAKGSTSVQPETLNDYAKTEDLEQYAKTSDLDAYAKTTDLNAYTKTRDELIDKCTILRCTSYDPYFIKDSSSATLTNDVPTFQKLNLGSGSYYFGTSDTISSDTVFVVAKPKTTLSNKGLDCSDTGLIGVWLKYEPFNSSIGTTSNVLLHLEVTSSGEADKEEMDFKFDPYPDSKLKPNRIHLKTGWNFYPLNVSDTAIANSFTPEGRTSGKTDISNINFIRLYCNAGLFANANLYIGQIAKITPGVNEEFDYDIFTLNNRTEEVVAVAEKDLNKKIFRILPNKDSTFIDGFKENILPISISSNDKSKYTTNRAEIAPNDTLESLGVGSLNADFGANPATGILFTIGQVDKIDPINCSDPGIIGLWLYFERKTTDSAIELKIEFTSSGKPDYQEIDFTLNDSNIKEGWNFYKFDLLATNKIPVRSGCIEGIRNNGNASVDPNATGPFNVSAVNFSRMYFNGIDPITGKARTKNCTINIGPMALLTKPLNNEFAYYDDYINALIDAKLGVIENGTY